VTARVSIEAAATLGWHKYVGPGGVAIGIDRFGASAPGKVVLEKLGFTPENILEKVRPLLRRNSGNIQTARTKGKQVGRKKKMGRGDS
jgi:transketolase